MEPGISRTIAISPQSTFLFNVFSRRFFSWNEMIAYGVDSRWDVAKFVVQLNLTSAGLLLQWFIYVHLWDFFVRGEGQACSDCRAYSLSMSGCT